MNGSDKQMREKINSPESTKGLGFDKSAAWDKLHMRLDNKTIRHNRKPYYYVGAAAAVLLICVSVFMQMQHKVQKQVESLAQQSPVTEPPAIPPPVTKPQTTAIIKNDRPVIIREKHTKTQVLPGVSTVIPEPVTTKILAPKHDSIKPAIPAIALQQKKMRTIHINELSNEPALMPPSEQQGFFTIVSPHRHYKNNTQQAGNNHPAENRLRLNFNSEN